MKVMKTSVAESFSSPISTKGELVVHSTSDQEASYYNVLSMPLKTNEILILDDKK